MRLWTIHPKYLDPVGLVALWREALLARAVLRGKTRGYRFHPQLLRFRAQADPVSALDRYLAEIHAEAQRRGYHFDRRKLGRGSRGGPIPEHRGQMAFEWAHLLKKLKARSPGRFQEMLTVRRPMAHPLFRIVPGPVQKWERGAGRP